MPISALVSLGVQLKRNHCCVHVPACSVCSTQIKNTKTTSGHPLLCIYKMLRSKPTLSNPPPSIFHYNVWLRQDESRKHESKGDAPLYTCTSPSTASVDAASAASIHHLQCCERLRHEQGELDAYSQQLPVSGGMEGDGLFCPQWHPVWWQASIHVHNGTVVMCRHVLMTTTTPPGPPTSLNW